MAARLIPRTLALAWPILVAQLAMMVMPIADTLMAGHYATADLAAVALGNSIYITVFLTLSGILAALSPTFAHHHGAGDTEGIRGTFQQGACLALGLSAIGVALLSFPHPLLAWTDADPAVLSKTIAYLRAIAWAMPGVMLYKVCSALLSATGHQRILMATSLIGVLANVPLNYLLMWGHVGLPALGAVGCGVATAVSMTLTMTCAALYLSRHAHYRSLALFARWARPRWAAQWQILQLGGPIAFSLLVEISAFTLISLFVARLGAETIGGHRIAAQMAGLCYMLPLALGTATSILVSQACGANDYGLARRSAWSGAWLAGGLATLLGVVIFLARGHIAALFSTDATVVNLASELMVFIALYQLFDGVQTISTFALRGYKVTLAPLSIHVFAFWVIGLGGGYWLAFYDVVVGGIRVGPTGAAGFWGASVASTVVAALLLGLMLRQVARSREADYALRQAH